MIADDKELGAGRRLARLLAKKMALQTELHAVTVEIEREIKELMGGDDSVS